MKNENATVFETGRKARQLIIIVLCVITLQIVASLVISTLTVKRIEATRINELTQSWNNFLDQKFKEVYNYVLGFALWSELNLFIKGSHGKLNEEKQKAWLSQNDTQNDICAIIRNGEAIVSGGKEFNKLKFLLSSPAMKEIYARTNKKLKSENNRYVLNYPAMTVLLVASPLYDNNGEAIITDGINIFGRILENNFTVASSFLNSKLQMTNSYVENPDGFIIPIKDTFEPKNVRYISVTPNINIGSLVFYPMSATTGMQVIIVIFIIITFFLLLKGITGLTIQFQDARDALWCEMELAKKIQTCLLPSIPRNSKYEIGAAMLPAAEVGGDYYDIVIGKDGRLWTAIGDVSGHGISAGLIMMMTQSTITSLIKGTPEISVIDVVTHLNSVLFQNIRERMKLEYYLTFLVLVEKKKGWFAFAGLHETIIIYHGKTKTCKEISTDGLLVGLLQDIKPFLKEGRFKLDPGDILVLYTDGVTEATDAEKRQFEKDGLKRSIEKNAHLPAQQLVNAIVSDVNAWMHTQKDDITIIALKYSCHERHSS